MLECQYCKRKFPPEEFMKRNMCKTCYELVCYLNNIWKFKVIGSEKGTKGIVLFAEIGSSPEKVALKTTLDPLDSQQLEIFTREARTWFNLRGHRLIMTPFHLIPFENRPLICMPYCELSLQKYIENLRSQNKMINMVECLIFSAQILKGLLFAKTRGVDCHQDLKPANIMLENLSRKFMEWPPLGLPYFRYQVRITDFGLANAYKEIGRYQGSAPYMAPEQYPKRYHSGKYEKYYPDIFAIGVIMTEMLTGLHPSGKTIQKFWKLSPRERFKWTESGERRINLGDDGPLKELENLIREMLSPEPDERPTLESAINKIMELLADINRPSFEQLSLLFDYFDTLASFSEIDRWQAMAQISNLPSQLEPLIKELLTELRELESKLNDDPKILRTFLELGYVVFDCLIKRAKEEDIEKAKDLACKMIEMACKKRPLIKTSYFFPQLEFKGHILIKTPPWRDFECFADVIGRCRRRLELVDHASIKEVLRKFDSISLSAWLFSIASDIHSCMRKNEKSSINYLDDAIQYNPHEPTLYYFKALWSFQAILLDETKLPKIKNELVELVLYLKRAIELDPSWEEPKELLRRINKLLAKSNCISS